MYQKEKKKWKISPLKTFFPKLFIYSLYRNIANKFKLYLIFFYVKNLKPPFQSSDLDLWPVVNLFKQENEI